jgi:hypothetical protein
MGVDPGVHGGIGVVDGAGRYVNCRALRPDMDREEVLEQVRDMLDSLRALGGNVVFLEKVGYMRGDGGKGAFTFGRVVGWLEMALESLSAEVRYVQPAIWQARLNCLSGGNKNVTKARAVSLFGPTMPPGESITHATADALLIAEYGRQLLAAEG